MKYDLNAVIYTYTGGAKKCILHAPGNSGPSVHADHKTGISLAHGFDSLVTRF